MFPQNNLVNLSKGLMIVPGQKKRTRVVACFETSLTSSCIKEPLRCVHTECWQFTTCDSSTWPCTPECDWFVALLGKRKIGCAVCSVLACRNFYRCRGASEQTASKTHQQCHSFVNGTASSRSQLVVSLSSAESELHKMASGCLDGIDIETCFWLARKLNSSNGLTTARPDSWFGDVWCIETWTESLPARWWNRDASKIQNLMLTVLQTTRDGSCWNRSTVEKLGNRTFLLVTEMADTARQQGRRNSADRLHAVAAIYKIKLMHFFFLAKWIFRGKCWNDATKTGKSQMVNRWSKLTDSRRSAWNFHSWTWDNMGWLPHIEMSVLSFLTPQPGPFWLKKICCPLRSEGSFLQGCWNWIYNLFTLG